jgi:hypothetical protein
MELKMANLQLRPLMNSDKIMIKIVSISMLDKIMEIYSSAIKRMEELNICQVKISIVSQFESKIVQSS